MINTISLCPVCYKKIEARITYENNQAIMRKSCDVHGDFEAVVERDAIFFAQYYQYGTTGRNNTIILHIENDCQLSCPWCYYDGSLEKMHPFSFYHELLKVNYRGFNLLFSGGEPTIRPDFFEFVNETRSKGWLASSITNMIKLADDDFFEKTLTPAFVLKNGTYCFSMSFQHPKNYSQEIYQKKLKALDNIHRAGLKANCVMFSISSFDELPFIREFYNATKHLYGSIRIRTLFHNWNNESEKELYLSDLYKAAFEVFSDLTPVISTVHEISTPYALFLELSDGGYLSLTSAPTVHNIDYNLASRPVYMLGVDGRCYPVPINQIISQGLSKGWKDGFQIQKGGK